jgi:hypothetical protein
MFRLRGEAPTPRPVLGLRKRLKRRPVREERSLSWHGEIAPEVVRAVFDTSLQDAERLDRRMDRLGPEFRSFLSNYEARTDLLGPQLEPSMSSFQESRPVNRLGVDVLILTALPKELSAVRANSGPWSRERDPETGFQY